MRVQHHGRMVKKPCDIGGVKEPGMMYFPTKCGDKEAQNPQNHRVVFCPKSSWKFEPMASPTFF